MKNRLLCVSVFLSLACVPAFGQEIATKPHSQATTKDAATLSQLSEQIRLKEEAIAQMTATSRGVLATAKAELNDLIDQYIIALNEELTTASGNEKAALTGELKKAEEKKKGLTSTNR